MENYILTMVVLISLEVVVMVVALSSGQIPQRTPGTVGFAVVVNIALVVWGVNVLA